MVAPRQATRWFSVDEAGNVEGGDDPDDPDGTDGTDGTGRDGLDRVVVKIRWASTERGVRVWGGGPLGRVQALSAARVAVARNSG